MNKKKMQYVSWGTTVFGALCGLVAFFMIFVTAIKEPLLFDGKFTGLQVALGYSVDEYPVFSPSAGIILAFLFPLLGASVAVIGKGYKVVTLIAAATMIVGGALAFACVSLLNTDIPLGSVSLGAGPIASGVLSLLGSCTLIGSIFVKG